MQKIIVYFLTIVIFACNNTNETITKSISTIDTITSTIDTSKNLSIKSSLPDSNKKDKLQIFRNIEIIDYCILLPLHEYKESFGTDPEKAEHVFTPIRNNNNYNQIKVKGFIIDVANEFNPALFYKRDLQEIEEDNLGIDSSYIDTIKYFYFIKGHLPNYPHKKYIHISWVQKDKISFDVTYTIAEEALWQTRLSQIIKQGVNCSAE